MRFALRQSHPEKTICPDQLTMKTIRRERICSIKRDGRVQVAVGRRSPALTPAGPLPTTMSLDDVTAGRLPPSPPAQARVCGRGCVPARTGHLRAPRPQDRPALRLPAHPAERRRSAHRQSEDLAGHLVRHRRHAEVEATWTIYQRTVAAYRHPDCKTGRTTMAAPIPLSAGVPKPLQEIITLGRTLKKRAADVLAYFDRPGTSNGPTEAINGRLEHPRGSALGLRNLTNYIARSLLETGRFRPQLHPRL